MKSYRQYCSVARALDVVGDRWVLLIVRELLALGPSRYTDLRRGLPGIATNLLADRLKAMEADGLIERYDAPPPVGTTLFRLTGRGRELQGVVQALARWGMASMPSGPDAQDAVQPHWSALAWVLLPGRPSPDAEVVVGIASEGETLCVVLRPAGDFEIRRGAARAADVTLAGTSMLIGAVLSGLLGAEAAEGLGLVIEDPRGLLPGLVAAPARAAS
ncbi:helix-turn-helix transcriptional regulator [Streptomyces cocklensis]|jgi:DNA-binding HxlR family transcriptional regulator|uniref:Transcriptional regulator, HxlR family n=1 Tax=Actinacidiphila cocklensis TaxID=887465 RepID=A0A9W4GS17_9ACTN|nr:helix-turn-helix domain-containing protein [Actinacidiphila cocklensis]MDD1057258.1 helix-turn-helix transcriptional regulator [Actinacidiphila cocklensis]WSX78418.1 helix-turn-helix transcriptional regulator [Streptomyces sp. NBC_00899]CAG6394984.1 Transcriptional regulator, HxlR family [Actinacidiphila cocklensis]